MRYSRELTDAFISVADEIEEDEGSVVQVHGVCVDDEDEDEGGARAGGELVFEVQNEDGVRLFSLPSSGPADNIEEQALISLRAAEMAGLIRAR